MKDFIKGFNYAVGATVGVVITINAILILCALSLFLRGFIKGLFGF